MIRGMTKIEADLNDKCANANCGHERHLHKKCTEMVSHPEKPGHPNPGTVPCTCTEFVEPQA